MTLGVAASVPPEDIGPIIATTLSLFAKLEATVATSPLSVLLSLTTNSIFLPPMPPLALISSAASFMAFFSALPGAA